MEIIKKEVELMSSSELNDLMEDIELNMIATKDAVLESTGTYSDKLQCKYILLEDYYNYLQELRDAKND